MRCASARASGPHDLWDPETISIVSLNVSPQRLLQACFRCFLFCRAVSIGYSSALVKSNPSGTVNSSRATQDDAPRQNSDAPAIHPYSIALESYRLTHLLRRNRRRRRGEAKLTVGADRRLRRIGAGPSPRPPAGRVFKKLFCGRRKGIMAATGGQMATGAEQFEKTAKSRDHAGATLTKPASETMTVAQPVRACLLLSKRNSRR